MKKIIISFIAFFVLSFSYAQESDQNPNYASSLKVYTQKLAETPNTMSTTVQDTYKAIDEKQDKKDAKAANKKAEAEYRQERRLARINNRGYSQNSNYAYNSYNPYGGNNLYGNYNRGYNNNNYSVRYNNRNFCTTSSFNRRGYRYRNPVGFRVGGAVRVGNVWVGF